jgi:Protein of unknown function (DUF3592)
MSDPTGPDTHSAGETPRTTSAPRATFVPDTTPLQGRSGREPPSWAMLLLVAIIGVVVLAFTLDKWTGGGIRPHLPFGGGDAFWVGMIFVPMLALILVAAGSKLIELRQAKSWVATTGRILSSGVETRRRRFRDEPEELKDVPAVTYEFKVGGRTIDGTRVSIGDEAGLDMDAVLARYPAGAEVTVYYDPRDPTRCVLERDFAQDLKDHNLTKRDVTSGCLVGIAMLAALGAAIWGLASYGPDFVRAHFPRLHSHAEMPVALVGFGLVMLMFFFAARRAAKAAASWPAVPGKIVKSEVEEYQERDDDDGRTTWRTAYRPAVEYAYAVNGREHRGNQINSGMSVSAGRGYAEKVAAQYPVGSAVDVHYDPKDPGTSALRTAGGAGAAWFIFGAALVVFALAAALLGVFG